MTPIDPEITGALIGVGALGGAWAAKHGFEYMRWKMMGSNGKCGNGGNGHCKDHQTVMDILSELKGSHEEEKQVELMVRAIHRANGGSRAPELRD